MDVHKHMLAIALSLGMLGLSIARAFFRRHSIKDKHVLIVGGSSGLGLAFAKILKKAGNTVTITSRSIEKLAALEKEWGFRTKMMDVGCIGTCLDSTAYEYIFCCAGIAHPSYFIDQPFDRFQESISTNYLGTVAVLSHYARVNKRPFAFIMVSSTLSLFTFPGFGSYSPSKAALVSLFYTVRDEMEKLGIYLYIYNTASILTPGYIRENATKPSYTRSIEEMSVPCSAEQRAMTFLNAMHTRRAVPSDTFTYLCQIRHDCECMIDYLLFPVAVVVVCASKAFCKWRFRRV
ncbi:dehydrogenase [Ordospora pajunii]|jgi:3-dehydrosphinganine reductase|uniref:dehydrogenase n=1 Tax=Ordospora pajunii TaxID=3039483 RepID=UPI00295287B3|nr:dehydrogenase [Ordospora pajunii]KAH9410633.1 dehydrogenase [Ordospora pajunii]